MNYKFTALIIFLMALLVIFAEPAYPNQDKIKTPLIENNNNPRHQIQQTFSGRLH